MYEMCTKLIIVAGEQFFRKRRWTLAHMSEMYIVSDILSRFSLHWLTARADVSTTVYGVPRAFTQRALVGQKRKRGADSTEGAGAESKAESAESDGDHRKRSDGGHGALSEFVAELHSILLDAVELLARVSSGRV